MPTDTKPPSHAEWDFTDARTTEPHPLDMAVAPAEPGDDRDLMPAAILAAIVVVIGALAGIAGWYGVQAVGWGM